MTKVKLCGMSRLEDIEAVNEIKPSYIGFIFWPKSFRCISKETALMLKSKLDKNIEAVGVFVDEELSVVADLLNSGAFDIIQLHGEESDDYIAELRTRIPEGTTIIKAFKADSKEAVERANKSTADFILFDPGKGEGMTFGWDVLQYANRPYFLAGGLDEENVVTAIRKLHPYAVDVSSSIETNKVKDKDKMFRFYAATSMMYY